MTLPQGYQRHWLGLSLISFTIGSEDSSDMKVRLAIEKKHRWALKRQSRLQEPLVRGKEDARSNATLYKTKTLPGSGADPIALKYYKGGVRRFSLSPSNLCHLGGHWACGSSSLLFCLPTCVLLLQQRLLVPDSQTTACTATAQNTAVALQETLVPIKKPSSRIRKVEE